MIEFALQSARGRFHLEASASFPESGISVLFGPSGAGKSSLLRALAGLDAATGHLRMGGQDVLALAPHKRGIGVVFQDARLFPHLDVAGNLAYAKARARRESLAQGQIIEALGIEPLLKRDCAGLSGGERQRVAIARALMAAPRLLLMDEPVSALDLKARAQVLGLIEALPQLAQIPILYVTHAIDEAARIADHMLLMREGRITLSGPIHEIFADPRLDDYTGHFEAGSLLEGRVAGFDRAYGLSRVKVEGAELAIPVQLPKGARLRLRIRARDVAVAVKKPSGLSIRNVIPAVLSRMAEEGPHAELFLQAGGGLIRARITRASAGELKLKPGMKLYALIKSIAVDRQLF